jgi:hypothetical protein
VEKTSFFVILKLITTTFGKKSDLECLPLHVCYKDETNLTSGLQIAQIQQKFFSLRYNETNDARNGKRHLIRRCFTMNGVIGIMNATAISLPLWALLIFALRMFL